MAREIKSLSSDVSNFLTQVKKTKGEVTQRGTFAMSRPRLLFSMDATASRESSWGVAQDITAAMFQAVPGTLDVALAYHSGGHLQEVTEFSSNMQSFLDKVQNVYCRTGRTALNDILAEATEIDRLKALIYIGDCFEEYEAQAVKLALELQRKEVHCFIFHDAPSSAEVFESAARVFAEIAKLTRGALLPFDEKSPEKVAELLEAIAVFAANGIKELEKRKNSHAGARVLLTSMKGN